MTLHDLAKYSVTQSVHTVFLR